MDDKAARGDFRGRPLSVRRTPQIKLAVHGAVYEWARAFVEGADVLDLGCAEGFGTVILSEAARKVVGVDWDADLIEQARISGNRPNVEYVVDDCHFLEKIGGPFDAVMNNALLEHVGDAASLMSTACEKLSAEGLMICGTKNYDLSLKKRDGSLVYDNHLREYTVESLGQMMNLYFRKVTLYSLLMSERAERFLMGSVALGVEGALVRTGVKSAIPRSVRKFVRRLVTGVSVHDLDGGDFDIRPAAGAAGARRAAYVLAVGEGRLPASS